MAFRSPNRQVRSVVLALLLVFAPAATADAQSLLRGSQDEQSTRQGQNSTLPASQTSSQPGLQPSFPAPRQTLPGQPTVSTNANSSNAPDATTLGVPPDGDFTSGNAPQIFRDGVFDATPPAPTPEDGLDARQNDLRSQEERRNFAFDANPGQPPEGDALLFQVEDITPLDPAANRRPARFATLEPFDPVGIRIGTFVLFPEAELAVARQSNVFSSPNGESDIVGQFTPSLRLVSNWSNHALEFRAEGDLQNYRQFGSENERGFLVEARGRLDITRRTNIQASLSRQSAQEDRTAVDASTAGPRANDKTDAFTAALNHRFNRLTVQLRGGVTDQNFSSSTSDDTTPGEPDTFADRDEHERNAAVRATWEFKPTLQVFAEVEGNHRAFETVSSADGLRRDSTGRRYRAGVSFGETNERLRGEVSLGYATQDIEDPGLQDADGFIIDANLAYRFNGLTSFLLTASSDIDSVTQTSGSGAVVENVVGLEMRHAFRRYLIGSASIEGTRRDYAGIDVDESEFVFGLGLEYFLSREAVFFSNYEHTVSRSDFANSDFEEDEIRVGIRLRR
ncbi:MAG: outer membrane beta-barrel protein [Filomicrobium sp.]